jgi:hypothetical protein
LEVLVPEFVDKNFDEIGIEDRIAVRSYDNFDEIWEVLASFEDPAEIVDAYYDCCRDFFVFLVWFNFLVNFSLIFFFGEYAV